MYPTDNLFFIYIVSVQSSYVQYLQIICFKEILYYLYYKLNNYPNQLQALPKGYTEKG